MMRTMYQTEEEAGLCLADSLEDFEQKWKSEEWEAQGSFCIPFDKVEVTDVIWEEEKEHDYGERIPIDYQTAAMAEQFNMNLITAALNGGEDYELLFTVPLADHDPG